MAPLSRGIPMRALLLVICVAAACHVALAAPLQPLGTQGQAAGEGEFAPRKAYRECLNRNFALRLIRERNVASPDTIAEEALLACRTEERTLGAFAEELVPVVKDRMKDWLVSAGHVPENLWWP
jgi:hypothetical protein